MASRHTLAVERLGKIFPSPDGAVTAVDDISFAIGGDDFFTMLGPSGCGKTTTLRLIAGLESPSTGRILFDGRDIGTFSALQRGIGMVFQSYALFPHMTVFENVAYGLRLRQVGGADLAAKANHLLDMLGLKGLAGRHPADLSGGQQQRVAIARALVYDPTMLLLDEPLANLDAKLRVQMREEIRRLQKSLGIMTIYVTHDQEEAMSISDRIGVFNLGRLMQFGTPQEIYGDPRSLFVADFVGHANFFKVVSDYDSAGRRRAVIPGWGEAATSRVRTLDPLESAALESGTSGLLLVRPEHLEISPGTGPGIPCRIRRVQFLGSFVRIMADCDAAQGEVTIDSRRPVPGGAEGSEARLSFAPEDAVLFRREGGA